MKDRASQFVTWTNVESSLVDDATSNGDKIAAERHCASALFFCACSIEAILDWCEEIDAENCERLKEHTMLVGDTDALYGCINYVRIARNVLAHRSISAWKSSSSIAYSNFRIADGACLTNGTTRIFFKDLQTEQDKVQFLHALIGQDSISSKDCLSARLDELRAKGIICGSGIGEALELETTIGYEFKGKMRTARLALPDHIPPLATAVINLVAKHCEQQIESLSNLVRTA